MENEQLHSEEKSPRYGYGALPTVVALLCLGLAVASLGLWVRERRQVQALDADRAQTVTALNVAKSQIQDLSSRLDALSASRQEAMSASHEALGPTRGASNRRAAPARKQAARAAVKDPRVDRLQSQVADQQKELAKTREDMTKAQQELDGKLTSTRDDLNGSIAKTHEEVVAMQKRGERNVYEFKLSKSKQFQRVGPLSLALRGTNLKHKSYDLTMVVDDNQLDKKHVNLYEPVWITMGDRPQPVELVVNRVNKNEIEGYLSEPKYKKSELTASSDAPAQKPQQQLTTR